MVLFDSAGDGTGLQIDVDGLRFALCASFLIRVISAVQLVLVLLLTAPSRNVCDDLQLNFKESFVTRKFAVHGVFSP